MHTRALAHLWACMDMHTAADDTPQQKCPARFPPHATIENAPGGGVSDIDLLEAVDDASEDGYHDWDEADDENVASCDQAAILLSEALMNAPPQKLTETSTTSVPRELDGNESAPYLGQLSFIAQLR